MRSIAVVGASLAGLTAARTLRAEGYDGTITLVDAEDEPPYDRPPLSKGYLDGSVGRDDLALLGPADDGLDLDWRLGTRAVSLDCSERSVELDDGTSLGFEGLVVATGAVPILPAAWAGSGAHVLRTRADAEALRADLVPGTRLVVVGSGFIGAEVATVARAIGCDVTVIGRESAPLERALGPRLGAALVGRYVERGIRLVTERAVTAVHSVAGRPVAVELDGSTRLDADVLLVAVGALPAVGWLEGSGLEVADGVLCGHGGAAGPEGVVAVGDCAAWTTEGASRVRHEHWTAALRRGAEGARRLLHGPAGAAPGGDEPPAYVWSDQLGSRLQIAGELGGGDAVWLLAEEAPLAPLGEEQLLAPFVAGVARDGTLLGVLAADEPRSFARWRRRIGQLLSIEARR